MKWVNKGHEYDSVFKNISEKGAFYLFGAGDYGRQLVHILENEIKILGFVDNDKEKYSNKICGIECISFETLTESYDRNTGIILTMSQIARVKPITQLETAGFVKNIDYFIIEEFLSVYYLYKHGKVYFSSISFLPSTRCNLSCRYCLNFNSFAQEFYIREYEDLIKDVDTFFKCVDRIMLFHVSGGEPMLYPHVAELIKYINDNYGNRIDTLRTVTNGTIVPKDEILKKLSETKIEITVDDYRKAIPHTKEQFDRLINKLNEYGIKHYINYTDSWIDLAPERTDYSSMDDEWLINHRSECSQSWQELRDGKIYSCNYASYAQVAGLSMANESEESFDLMNYDESRKKELIEFRLGYSNRGYTAFCKKCRGFTERNSEAVIPAVQI